jgi:hypothetical protein
MRFFGFGKKRNPDPAHSSMIPKSRHDPPNMAMTSLTRVGKGADSSGRHHRKAQQRRGWGRRWRVTPRLGAIDNQG